MERVALEGGGWFDKSAAKKYEEATWFDGSNRISKATGSQWDHQELYQTRSGGWVLYSWSQWQGRGESYRQVTPAEAADWLITNNHEIPDVLEEVVQQSEV